MRFGRYNFFCGRIHLNVSDQIIMTLITSDCPHWQLSHIVVDRIWALPQHLCQNQANDLGIFVFRSRKCYFEPKMSYDIHTKHTKMSYDIHDHVVFMSSLQHHLWKGWGYVILVIFFSIVFNIHTFFELTTARVVNHSSEGDNGEG